MTNLTPKNIEGTLSDNTLIKKLNDGTFAEATSADIIALGGGGGSPEKIETFIAGEDIGVGEHVFLGSYTEQFTSNSNIVKQYPYTANNNPQTINISYGCAFDRPVNAPLLSVTPQMLLASTGNGSQSAQFTYNLVVSIYNITGTYGTSAVNTGSTLATSTTQTGTLNFTQTASNLNFTFPTPANLSIGQYALKIEGTLSIIAGTNSGTGLVIYGDLLGGYSGNDIDGSSAIIPRSMGFAANSSLIAARIADASFANRSLYLGVATESKNITENIAIKTRGSIVQTGATNNEEVWYLSNTPGALAASPGTNNVIVGRGSGTNTLRLRGLSDVSLDKLEFNSVSIGVTAPIYLSGGGLVGFSINSWTGDNRAVILEKSINGTTRVLVSETKSPFSSSEINGNRHATIEKSQFIRFRFTASSGGSANINYFIIPF